MARQLRMMLEMIRFSHTLFALPFALLAAVMAWKVPVPDSGGQPVTFRWLDFVAILLCMVTARSAAMSFNRLADHGIDAANPRTANRHLVTGEITFRAVVWFCLANILAFVLATCLFLPNRLPLLLSVPVIVFLGGYSYTKRFTSLAHFWLGAALMLAPICTWIALRGNIVWNDPADILPAVVVGCAVLLWVAGFDIIYACQDEAFDRAANLRSIPVRLGIASALRLSAACHAAMILLLLALPWLCPQVALGGFYLAGIIVVAALLIYEHWLVRPDDLQRVNLAFFQVNAIISIGLFLVVTIDLLT